MVRVLLAWTGGTPPSGEQKAPHEKGHTWFRRPRHEYPVSLAEVDIDVARDILHRYPANVRGALQRECVDFYASDVLGTLCPLCASSVPGDISQRIQEATACLPKMHVPAVPTPVIPPPPPQSERDKLFRRYNVMTREQLAHEFKRRGWPYAESEAKMILRDRLVDILLGVTPAPTPGTGHGNMDATPEPTISGIPLDRPPNRQEMLFATLDQLRQYIRVKWGWVPPGHMMLSDLRDWITNKLEEEGADPDSPPAVDPEEGEEEGQAEDAPLPGALAMEPVAVPAGRRPGRQKKRR